MRRIYVIICLLLLCLWNTKSIKILIHYVGNLKPRTAEGWTFNASFPVDLVYTWVNGSDPKHQASLAYLKKVLRESKTYTATRELNLAKKRFADYGGLRYSLRSMEQNANWIRHVFIVTNGQIPNWLNLENPRVTIIKHTEIFDNPEDLPTFSPMATEHNIFKINGLSERFIYMNDDMLFGQTVSLEDLYTEQKGTKVFLAWSVPDKCGEHCNIKMIKNDVCDRECNYDHCAWDGGDCEDIQEQKPKDKDTGHCDYWTAVLYTSAIYNRAFSTRKRRFIAHAPLFMIKNLYKEMVKRFPNEVQNTIQHKVRDPTDFEFATSYMYFLMEGNNSNYRFEPKVESPDVYFVMVSEDEIKTRNILNMLMKSKRKFVCINDNIDYSQPAATDRAIALLEEYYESMFPNPSSFEKSQ